MHEKAKFDSSIPVESFQLAGIGSRFFATVIDGIIVGLVSALLVGLISMAGLPIGEFIGLVLPVVYYWYFWTRRDGQTPGKSAVGIRVVKVDGSELSDTDALIRAIGYHVSALIFGLGFIWAIFDANNQTWHDKMARTYVVRADSSRKSG